MELVFNEPIADCKVKVGEFVYLLDEHELRADFYVECSKAKNIDDVSRNMDTYNRQLEDEWMKLESQGARIKRYTEVTPCPLLY